MPKYVVRFVKVTEAYVNIEAEDESEAAEGAYDRLPGVTAYETGWGSHGEWGADVSEWQYLDEFFGADYSEEKFGPVVELVED